ncbi:hypothetical protein I6J42_34800 (plasmid) [Streptomyces californicus]|uniref:Uncharacterized protein n=1 Tax=Streptomyces californicus TaxID=67351 RepID=A0ABD7D6T8_9ACTN|nr:hypothetical protein [Streptomyces californicus]QRV39237.1 hypothetical protein I6J42_34800 [Streptomyces californicus]QRV52689.1 hypothetical protein I6J43_34820 [Streptomyces californicus]
MADEGEDRALRMLDKASRKNAEVTAPDAVDAGPGEGKEALDVTDLGAIPSQVQTQESPTIAVARERLVEAIGREAAFLADQRAGQAAQGLEALARAFALVSGGPVGTAHSTPADGGLAIQTRGMLPADQDAIVHRETVELTQR